MGSWVAIDFETANEHRGSPCSVGMALVEDGAIQRTESFLIRPPEFRFNGFNMALHGITPAMCQDAPEWPAALEQILAFADGRTLVAHYAAFDMGVIRNACDVLGMPWPDVRYACTLVVARRTWPGLVSYSLPFVVAQCGGDPWDHHDAAGDANAAAQVGLAELGAHHVTELDDLLESVSALYGHIDPNYWAGCHSRTLASSRSTAMLPTASPDATFDPSNPLYGRTVAFTGEMSVVRREAQQLVVDAGGSVAVGVSKKVNILVTGYQDMTRLAAGHDHSGKYLKAEQLLRKGHEIEIMSERDFFRAVRSSNAIDGHRSTAA